MTDKEALKLALKALEGLFGIPDYWTSEGGGGVAVWRMGGSDAPRQAITAIKEALAQPDAFEQGKQEGMKQERALWELSKLGQEIEAQPEELVFWGVDWSKDGDIPCAIIIKRLPDGGMELMAMEYGPPQRPWVGLTGQEKALIASVSLDVHDAVHRTDAKLKEKNFD